MAQEVKTFFPKSEALSSSPLVVHICRQPICNTILLKSGHAQQKFVAWFSQSLILLYDFKSVAEWELPFFCKSQNRLQHQREPEPVQEPEQKPEPEQEQELEPEVELEPHC